MAGALGLSLAARAQATEPWGTPTPAADDPERPTWPPRETVPLWPAGRMPGAPATLPTPHDTMNGPRGERQLWLYGIPQPFVAVYRPPQPNGRALLSIPGGGYGFLSVQNEGIDVARVFCALGYTVFVLVYRLPGEGWTQRADVPLQDAQRAMRLIRARAADWRVDPDRLGIVGFSAGGHLGGALATRFDAGVYAPIDAADRHSARPAFAGLIYPVITISLDRKGGSFTHLLGPAPSAASIAAYEVDRHVGADTPPVFLVQAADDPVVAPQNSLNMVAAMRAANRPVEFHLFQKGGHGFGPERIGADAATTKMWPALFDAWISMQGA